MRDRNSCSGDGVAISTRYLTAADNLGFSLHGVRLRAGASMELWYKHHWEANLIASSPARSISSAPPTVTESRRREECISSACSIRR